MTARTIGFLVSFAIHFSAVAFLLSSGPVDVSRRDALNRVAGHERVLPQGLPTSSSAHRTAIDPRIDGPISRPIGADESRSRNKIGSIVGVIQHVATTFQSGTATWVTHLWQSTVFALGVGLLTIAFRRNQARVRYWLWFSASLKFLFPFAVLTTLGSTMPWASAVQAIAVPGVSLTMLQFGQPFLEGSAVLPGALSTPAFDGWAGLAAFSGWACGFAAVARMRWKTWCHIRSAVRASVALEISHVAIPPDIRLRSAPGLLEPGVVGIWRPILLLPAGIEAHLTPAQLEAVLTHEVCHIRSRDNLTAAVHMLGEAIFWFHPLVWWIGARLVDERERACDEEVLRHSVDPRVYADGILNVCRRYVDARLACISGVSGSDLQKRIETIMRNQDAELLSASRKLLLAAAGVAAIGIPIAIGTLNAPLGAQSLKPAAGNLGFETSSVRQNRSGSPGWTLEPQPGGRLTGTNVPAAALIRFAYELPDFQVSGGPAWLNSDRFDIAARAEGEVPLAEKRLMLRKLLAERFRLAAHTETRDLPIYALVMARGDGRLGPQLRRAEADCARADQPSQDGFGVGPSPSGSQARCGFFGFGPGTNLPAGRGGLAFRGLTMPALAKALVPMVRRSVSDQTGLTGYFDADFDFMVELPPPPPPPGLPNPWVTPFVSVFTVFPEQLGLKLDSRRGPVEVLVIDHAEAPTPN